MQFLKGWVAIYVLSLIGSMLPAIAQTPLEDTVPGRALGTQIVDAALGIQLVSGGTKNGANLFHSFTTFDIPVGRSVYFSNPTGVQNILARVTGGQRSLIQGTIGVLGGNANLFLLNPSGILFDQTASLDLGGSFIATTANAIRLGNTGRFDASIPEQSNLLSVEPSALLFNQISPQAEIINRSVAQTTASGLILNGDPIRGILGLQVLDQQNLLLIGGNVSFTGGYALAPGGRLELGGLAASGTVELGRDGKVQFPEGVLRSQVTLDQASLGVGAENGGNIGITANNIQISNGSLLSAGIARATAASQQSGDIVLDAIDAIRITQASTITNLSFPDSTTNAGEANTGEIRIKAGSFFIADSSQLVNAIDRRGTVGNIIVETQRGIEISGKDTGIYNRLESQGTGRGGTIEIRNPASLRLSQGAQIQALVQGQGEPGKIMISTPGDIVLQGQQTGILTSVQPGAIANVGDITIQARSLSVQDGAQVQAIYVRSQNNQLGGQAPQIAERAATINIQTTDSIRLSGTSPDGFSSGILSSTERGARGRGGNTIIKTGTLEIANGAILSSQTLNDSNGGDLSVDVDRINLINGGQILSLTRGAGQAGNITVQAKNAVTIVGSDPTFAARLDRFKSDIVNNAGASSGIFASATETATGAGNNIRLEAGTLNLSNTGQISAQSQGRGRAGNLSIQVQGLFSATDGKVLTAATTDGGNIEIAAQNVQLQGDSDIRTDVANGAGGNITIKADSILAFNDSDIFAFAQRGRGGNITLATAAFFGQNYRPSNLDPQLLDRNNRVDINASGTLSGVISLPDTSFVQNNLSQLPQSAIDTNALLTSSCITRNRQNGTFYITGTGGMPTNPGDLANYPTGTIQPTWKQGDPIVEPQGIYPLPNGQLVMSRACDPMN